MPKYIEKNKLPQFQYYNFCEGREYGWDFGNGQDSTAYYKAIETNNGIGPVINTLDYDEGKINFEEAHDDFEKLLNSDDSALFQQLYDKWITLFEEHTNEWNLTHFALNVLRAVHKDKDIALMWEERLKKAISNMKPDKTQLLEFLALLDEYLSFALSLRTAQGFPLRYRDGELAYPKMLLIEDKLYNSIKGNKDIQLDYSLIKKAVMNACYVITINGTSAEKKMIFLIVDTGSVISVHMLDRRNGLSKFFVGKIEPKNDDAESVLESVFDNTLGTVVAADLWHCHPRGDYACTGNDNLDSKACLYCDGHHNCKHKSLDIISAVLYCFQEYYKKQITEQYTTPSKSSTSSKNNSPVKAYIPNGMMRLYDIPMSADEFKRVDKYALFNKQRSDYISTEKSPHVRRGTMRYNPKTGLKDIKVRGSIIHADKYQGFVSAERLKR